MCNLKKSENYLGEICNLNHKNKQRSIKKRALPIEINMD